MHRSFAVSSRAGSIRNCAKNCFRLSGCRTFSYRWEGIFFPVSAWLLKLWENDRTAMTEEISPVPCITHAYNSCLPLDMARCGKVTTVCCLKTLPFEPSTWNPRCHQSTETATGTSFASKFSQSVTTATLAMFNVNTTTVHICLSLRIIH